MEITTAREYYRQYKRLVLPEWIEELKQSFKDDPMALREMKLISQLPYEIQIKVFFSGVYEPIKESFPNDPDSMKVALVISEMLVDRIKVELARFEK